MLALITRMPKPGDCGGCVVGPPLSIQRSAFAGSERLAEGARARLFVVKDGRAVLRSVQLGRVLGEEVEVLSGLKEGDAVIRNFPDDLADGEAVQSRVPR